MDEIEVLKEELRQTRLAYQMANQMGEFKGGFLARTAHELRSPLSSLMGLHQLILSDLCENPEEQREFIAQAYKCAQKLMKIIDEIIFISKLQSGRAELDIQSWPLREIFEQLYVCTHLQAANRNIRLEFEYPDREIYVLTDLKHFLQLLINLIDTSINYTELGTIRISTNIREDTIEIYIDSTSETQQWSEPIDFLQNIPNLTLENLADFDKQLELSPWMKILLSQTLLEIMGGGLEIFELPENLEKDKVTRIKCLVNYIS